MTTHTVLIVDDEASIRDMIAMSLELNDYTCIHAENAINAHNIILEQPPDIILLDWMMPGISGIELARRLKRDVATKNIPIIMLTAKTEESDKINGLDSGADDYITKPFSIKELMARIQAVLRRSSSNTATEQIIKHNNLVIDQQAQIVTANGEALKLGPTEYKILHFFMLHPDRAFTREQLLDSVWGSNVYIDDRTVDVHIRRLRKILATYSYDSYLQTVRGTGYRFSIKL